MIHRLMKNQFQDSRNETIWLTIYADLITNLVLVFLALYGLTIMGNDALSQALQSMKLTDIKIEENLKPVEEFDHILPTLKNELTQSEDLIVSGDSSVARIEFGEKVLFESGQANLKSLATPLLMQVSSILKTLPYTIVVEGHTDNVPLLAGSAFKSNRELSLARSMSVIRLLLAEGGIDPAQFAASAYGSYRPRASNVTAIGRRANRRVEILLLKGFPYKKGGNQNG